MNLRSVPYVVGVDIGGANLKLADSTGRSSSCSFPMWLQSNQLGETLTKLLENFPPAARLAVTMTGELADCFATRREGVDRILDQVALAFSPRQTIVYAVGNRWLTPDAARRDPWSVAASNWHALATWICSHPPESLGEAATGSAVLLDIGSTTTDIIPLRCAPSGKLSVATAARTDRDRLELKQLVYTGVERTPLAAVVREVVLHGRICPLMAERFATSDDCYLVLGEREESPADEGAVECDTADGRPRTVAAAHARIARMIGEDGETLPLEDAQCIARQIAAAQATQIAAGLQANWEQLVNSDASLRSNGLLRVIVGGHARQLAERALQHMHGAVVTTWLDSLLSPAVSRSAPAAAVACLLEQTYASQG